MVTLRIFGESVHFNDVDEGAGRGMHFIVNGWVLSAQSGWGSYCSADPNRSKCRLNSHTIRTDCEIALWQVDNKDLIHLDGDSVMGWVCWDMVFDIIEWLRKQKQSPDEEQVRRKVLSLKNEYDKKGENND